MAVGFALASGVGSTPAARAAQAGGEARADAPHPDLLSLSTRVRIGGERVIGREQPEAFREVDVAATLRLPWRQAGDPAWGWSTRLLASVGVLKGQRDYAGVISLVPLLAWGSRDGRYSVDAGLGGALLSRHRFAQQDFGGYGQFALTAGVTVPLGERLGVGYRFMHYSDAGLHGSDTIGADFHMLEVVWRF